MEMEIGTTPYRKLKGSSKSKASKKSNHKHDYESCLIRYIFPKYPNLNGHLSSGHHCKICGLLKEGNDGILLSEKEPGTSFYRCLSNEEILAKYPNLPIFEKII